MCLSLLFFVLICFNWILHRYKIKFVMKNNIKIKRAKRMLHKLNQRTW